MTRQQVLKSLDNGNKAFVDSRLAPDAAFWGTQPSTVVVSRPTDTTIWRISSEHNVVLDSANWSNGMKARRHL